jgi:hypothetical protein
VLARFARTRTPARSSRSTSSGSLGPPCAARSIASRSRSPRSRVAAPVAGELRARASVWRAGQLAGDVGAAGGRAGAQDSRAACAASVTPSPAPGGVEFVFGIDANPAFVGRAKALADDAWKPFARPESTAKRRRPVKVKRAVIAQRGFRDLELEHEHVAEIDYRPGKCQSTYPRCLVGRSLSQISPLATSSSVDRPRGAVPPSFNARSNLSGGESPAQDRWASYRLRRSARQAAVTRLFWA